jgi:hypothetical protein
MTRSGSCGLCSRSTSVVHSSICLRNRSGEFSAFHQKLKCSIFWNLYVGLVYGVLYLSFVAYPVVFQSERGWSPSMGGLAFCGIGFGTLLVIACEPLCRWIINQHRRDPETGKPYPEAAVSIVCFGAVLLAVGQMVFAWTSAPHIHWIFPIVFGGIPFGAGNASVFIYSNNYLAGSYGNFAASCLAGNAVVRSIMGGCLPLAGPKMYTYLGSAWASCVLSLLEFAFVPIPVIFYFYGDRIRNSSTVIRQIATYK